MLNIERDIPIDLERVIDNFDFLGNVSGRRLPLHQGKKKIYLFSIMIIHLNNECS